MENMSMSLTITISSWSSSKMASFITSVSSGGTELRDVSSGGTELRDVSSGGTELRDVSSGGTELRDVSSGGTELRDVSSSPVMCSTTRGFWSCVMSEAEPPTSLVKQSVARHAFHVFSKRGSPPPAANQRPRPAEHMRVISKTD
ncbi:hypothetical protein EYF80_050719 [Liparis tanakae]|uniref:Uncharacterized protein n=1 Tax=Liparis tanakae TaxID=230148 RepID=A0A4Z2FED6_9TELE|nr:hypothetical protein EYF80_050719 [Liparis tanakae]